MTHPADFLAAVLARPGADAPRLAYADWLDQHGDPLGKFIRVQCRLASLPWRHPEILELEETEHALLAEHELEWTSDLAGLVQWCGFRRGFVEEVALTSEQFLEYAPLLFTRAPIQEVHLSAVRDRLGSIASSAFLEKPSYLDLSSNAVRDHGAKTLAQSPHLAQVRGLNLSSSGIGDTGLRALAASPHLGNLRELYLDDNRISDSGVRQLAASPLANRLESLYLRFNAIGSDGASLLQRRFGGRVHL